MARTILLALVAVLVGHGVASAQLLEVEARYWFTGLKASAAFEGDLLDGTRVDFEDDLGLDSDELPEIRVAVGIGPLGRLRAAYTRAVFDGTETLERSIVIDDTTFAAGTRVEGELELHYGRLGWIWQFPVVPGLFRIGPMVELKGFWSKATVESSAVRESARIGVLLPTIGVAMNLSPHDAFHLFAEASGIPAGGLGHLVDAEAGVRVIPIRFLSLNAGYRIFDIRAEHGGDFGKFQLSGPFVGASLRF